MTDRACAYCKHDVNPPEPGRFEVYLRDGWAMTVLTFHAECAAAMAEALKRLSENPELPPKPV